MRSLELPRRAAAITRRFSRDLQFGFSYTFSKLMDYTGIPIYRPLRQWAYWFDGHRPDA